MGIHDLGVSFYNICNFNGLLITNQRYKGINFLQMNDIINLN